MSTPIAAAYIILSELSIPYQVPIFLNPIAVYNYLTLDLIQRVTTEQLWFQMRVADF